MKTSTHGAFPADHLDEATERLFKLAQPPVLEERDFLEAVQLFERRHELGEDSIGQPGRLGRTGRKASELERAESASFFVRPFRQRIEESLQSGGRQGQSRSDELGELPFGEGVQGGGDEVESLEV